MLNQAVQHGRGTMKTESIKSRAITVFRMNFSGAYWTIR